MADGSNSSSSSNKRTRDSSPPEEWPEAKRLRDDILFDILDDDDDDDTGCRDPAVQDLAYVMRSLEEEIALPPPAAPDPVDPAADLDVLHLPDLGFLLEASDDELGLPPTGEAEAGGGDVEAAAFGQIWGLGDEIQLGGYDERTDFGEAIGYDDGGLFDGGLFDYDDVISGPADFSESGWRPESLPAV